VQNLTDSLNSAIPQKYHVLILLGLFAYSHRQDAWKAICSVYGWVKERGGLRSIWNDFIGPHEHEKPNP
jgi:hypothetical protein